MTKDLNKPIGYIVGGSLKQNLQVRLTVPAQEVQEGGFVVTESENWKFYGLITDMQLGATDPRFADEQNETRLPSGLSRLLYGKTLFTNLEVMSALMLDMGPEPGSAAYEQWRADHPTDPYPMPVKTVPAHQSPVHLAKAGDVAEIFGKPEDENRFVIGHTREQNHPVCIDIEKFVQRSSGIFGATGSGKSFLTRIILAGLIRYNKSSLLVFDMHNEYGLDSTSSDTGERVVGLRSKFPLVRIAGLGKESAIAGQSPDFHLEILHKDIQSDDILMLTRELNLKETTPATLDALVNSFGSNWFNEFGNMKVGTTIENEDGKRIPAPDSVAFWANQAGINTMAAEALRTKLNRVYNRKYLVEESATNGIRDLIEALEAGQHIILSFGNYSSDLDYLLVTNLLTRLIRESWIKKTEQARIKHTETPKPLVIVIEEAHKLLNREMASQTTFNTIAREMRKYYVTLLIVDQRPSQIYDEVMSQLGTRISGWLGDDSDVQAVLSGLAGREALRGMLSRLQPKEEVLMLGWGVPMPIPVRSRRYNDKFWLELLKNDVSSKDKDQLIKELGFD